MESKASPSRSAELSFLPSQSLRVIKAMWALRAFILLPLAAAFRSEKGLSTAEGYCLSKREGSDWAKKNGPAVRQCRLISQWQDCVGMCRWESGQPDPGFCIHSYAGSTWAQDHEEEVAQCRANSEWQDCVGLCKWVSNVAYQRRPSPPRSWWKARKRRAYCNHASDGSEWAETHGAEVTACRVLTNSKDCTGDCVWLS